MVPVGLTVTETIGVTLEITVTALDAEAAGGEAHGNPEVMVIMTESLLFNDELEKELPVPVAELFTYH